MSKSATRDGSPLSDLTGFQRDLLATIRRLDGEPHGLAIKEALGDAWGEEINHGRLYPNLDTLVNKGLVEKGSKDDRTNSYALTRRGRRELEADCKWRSIDDEDGDSA